MSKKVPMKITVRGVCIGRGKVQNVRFRILPKTQRIRVTAMHQTPLFVKQIDSRFGIAPQGELPVLGNSPSEALAKGVRRFWN